jgi:hypothetical protein
MVGTHWNTLQDIGTTYLDVKLRYRVHGFVAKIHTRSVVLLLGISTICCMLSIMIYCMIEKHWNTSQYIGVTYPNVKLRYRAHCSVAKIHTRSMFLIERIFTICCILSIMIYCNGRKKSEYITVHRDNTSQCQIALLGTWFCCKDAYKVGVPPTGNISNLLYIVNYAILQWSKNIGIHYSTLGWHPPMSNGAIGSMVVLQRSIQGHWSS